MSKFDEDGYRKIYDTFADLNNDNDIYDQYRNLQQYHQQMDFRADDIEDFVSEDELIKEEEQRRNKFKSYNGLLDDEVSKPVNPLPNQAQDELYEEIKIKRKQKKYTQKELENIRESCKITYVRDYAIKDNYHLSDEERKEVDILHDIRHKLLLVKSGYKDPREYVIAMRTVVKAWELLAERNQFHTPDEFFKLVEMGEIVSPSIPTVELMNKKDYGIDRLIEYISNPELDVDDLIPKDIKSESLADDLDIENDKLYKEYKEEFMEEHQNEYLEDISSPEEIDKNIDKLEEDAHYYAVEKVDELMLHKLFSLEEVEYILHNREEPEVIKAKALPKKYIKDYDNRGRHRYNRKKKLSKADKRAAKNIHLGLNILEAKERDSIGYINSMDSMFKHIHTRKSMMDDIGFHGSLQNKYDVELFDMQSFDKYMREPDPNHRFQTNGYSITEEFFNISENEYDLNMIKMRRNLNKPVDGRERLIDAKTRKENKKKEYNIINRLIKLNNSKQFKKEAAKVEKKMNKM